MTILHRFEDRETEAAFLRAERIERGQAIRALIAISIATLISYIFINPMHLPRDGVIEYSEAAGFLIAVLAAFFALTRTELYLARPWIDLPIFVFVAAGMKLLALVLSDLAPITGIPPHAIAAIQMAILLIFASVAFAGTFRLFAGWATVVFALFALWLLTRPGLAEITRMYTLTNFTTFYVFSLYFNWDIERRARKVFVANKALEAERAKTEELLFNVLPQEVAGRLREGKAVADSFSDLTVMFVDLAGFSRLAKRLSPGHLVQMLNSFFSAADAAAERHGIEKVKTIGDAYLAVAGGMASQGADSKAAVAFARDLVEALRTVEDDTGLPIRVRIGIHTGPAVGGVIGNRRMAYDYWGDTLNIASRLQGCAPLNGIAVSESTYFQTRDVQEYAQHDVILKGIGETACYQARFDPRPLEA